MPKSIKTIIVSFTGYSFIFSLLIAAGVIFAGNTLAVCAGETDEQATTFATAEEAFKKLSEAYRNNDEALLVSFFGSEHKDFVMIADKTAAREDRLKFAKHYDEYADVVYEDKDKALLLVGRLAWPFPIPVIRAGDRWHFDAAEGKEEILNRRIGRNELAAIDICNAYVEAQRLYASEDRDGDLVAEYAQKLASSPGQKDGLYWETAEDEEESPFGPLVSGQPGYFEGKEKAEPVWGYHFLILPRQGDKVPGGKYEYIINGNMIAGFALAAYPAEYGSSGIMTFLVNHQGLVYQKDLGENTQKLAGEISEYNPDDTWTAAVPE